MWEKMFGSRIFSIRIFYKQIQGCVKPGGRLIYGTCSLLHQENAGVVEAFEFSNEGENFQIWPFKTGRWHGFFNLVVVSNMFIFRPGEMIQFDVRIFFRWVGEKPPTSSSSDSVGPGAVGSLS